MIILAVILSSACSKQELAINPVGQESLSFEYVLDSVPLIINPNKIELYLINESDADDEKINGQLLNIGIAVRELLTDNSMNSYILESAKQNRDKSLNLFTFASNPKIKSSGSGYEKLITALNIADLTHRSQNPLKSGVVEEYEPAIYVPNIETADPEKQPIVCPGFEVNCELSGMEDYEDYIVGWYYDDEGIMNEILINESTVMNTTNPVFIIINGSIDPEMKAGETMINNAQNGFKSATGFIEYQTLGFQINHRYENSGKSEFCITGFRFDEQGVVHTMLKKDGDWSEWKKIMDVDKDDIGDLLSKRAQFCSEEVLPFNTNYAFFNTWERDWYASHKPLGTATRYGQTIYLYGDMKYENEWYQYDPSIVNTNPVDFNTIYATGSKWHMCSDNKGKLQIVWVNVTK